MSEADIEPPKRTDRWEKLGEALARRAVLVGIVTGGAVGLAIGAIIISIVRGRRREALEREDRRLIDEFEAEQERKKAEQRRW